CSRACRLGARARGTLAARGSSRRSARPRGSACPARRACCVRRPSGMIVIPELGDGRHQMWCDLFDLAEAFPSKWTIIGAHMVALYAWEAGLASRPSDDVDVLVNVRLATDGTQAVSQFLQDRGCEP